MDTVTLSWDWALTADAFCWQHRGMPMRTVVERVVPRPEGGGRYELLATGTNGRPYQWTGRVRRCVSEEALAGEVLRCRLRAVQAIQQAHTSQREH